MSRGIFLAGNESSLFNVIAREAGRGAEQYAAALIPNRQSPAGGEDAGDGRRISLPWNPGSPISARTLMVAAENKLGEIEEAILVCSPPALYRRPEALAPQEIEALVNDQIKGWFYLVRELVLLFRRKNSGVLALVAPEILPGGRDGPADLLGPAAAASFRAFAQGLLASAHEEPFYAAGFSAEASGSEEEARFAAYILKNLREGNKKNSGKWYKYSKLNILNRLK